MRSLVKQPILGLDIGSFSMKAVCIQKSLMGLEWIGAYQKELSHPQGPFDWAKDGFVGLKDWISELRLPTGRVTVSLPSHLISLRTLSFPFNDTRKLEKIVPFEIESLLPYPLEEVVVDYHPLETAEGKSTILAAVAPVALIRQILAQFSIAGIDPEAVEVDGMALMNLVRSSRPEPTGRPDTTGDTLVLDIGSTKTIFCILRRGQTVFLRTILWGGQNVTAALSSGCGIPLQEAEELKRNIGLTDEDLSGSDRMQVSQLVRRSVEPFLAEILRTIHVCRVLDGLEVPVQLSGITLYGGGSKLRGLDTYLSSELEVPSLVLKPNIVSGREREWDPAFAIALGLALKGGQLPGVSRMNFRKGEFAHSREAEGISAKVRYLWIGAILVIALGAADLYAKYRLQQDHYLALKSEVHAQFTTMFPEIHNIVDEVQQARTALNELKKKAALFGTNEWTPLQIMAELTKRMPPSVKIEVQDIAIEPGHLRLEAETDSFESVDKIKASLGQFEAFRDVTVSDAKVSADQSKVRFRMTMTLAGRGFGPVAVPAAGGSSE